MRVLQINQNYNFGSTGRIMKEINDSIVNTGNEGYMLTAYANGFNHHLYSMESLPTIWAVRKNLIINRLTGLTGYKAKRSTQKAVRWIDSVKPDIIHLHNIHGDWIHIETLFDYIKNKKIPIVWTLHDCWSFTGRCSYFDNIPCFKWRTKCEKCPELKVYPKSYFFDFSKKMYNDKKVWFTGLSDATIVTPSNWLGEYVKQSYLGEYPVKVINNGIDLSQFEQQVVKSKYLEGEERKVVLGVAASWTPRKGLEDFVKLKDMLPSKDYIIVVVGLNAIQAEALPPDIIGIKRTKNVNELAQLYSQASVFVNPTYQDNYPTVNLEAMACGTPVITYNTGGSVESVTPDTGIIVEKGDVAGLATAVKQICTAEHDYASRCVEYAQSHFAKNERYNEYVALYEEMLNNL